MLLNDPFKSSRFVRTAPRILSRAFDGHRVDVLVPRDLTATTPILLIHDGMNVFFERFASTGHTWQIREAVESGRVTGQPLVVAVWGEGGTQKFNPRRINEFLCDDIFAEHPHLWETLNPGLVPPTRQPRGNYFINLIADEILPALAAKFGVEPHPTRTALAGCSVAGVASIYALAKRPEVFGAALGLSSHWEFGGQILIDSLCQRLEEPRGRLIWSDIGTKDLDVGSLQLNDYLGRQLTAQGWRRDQDFATQVFWGTGHSELHWSRRLEYPVNFWLHHLSELA